MDKGVLNEKIYQRYGISGRTDDFRDGEGLSPAFEKAGLR